MANSLLEQNKMHLHIVLIILIQLLLNRVLNLIPAFDWKVLHIPFSLHFADEWRENIRCLYLFCHRLVYLLLFKGANHRISQIVHH